MSAVPSNIAPAAKASDANGVTIIAGKVTHVRPYRTQDRRLIHFVHIAMPAEDEFGHPNTVEVNAGTDWKPEVGDRVRARCKLNGFPRVRKGSTNQETGEQRPGFKTCDLSLNLVTVL